MNDKYNDGQVLCPKCHSGRELETIDQDNRERTKKFFCKNCKIEFPRDLSDDSSVYSLGK